MKKSPYIIASAIFFIAGFPLAHLILRPLYLWLTPEGVVLTYATPADSIQVAIRFSIALAVLLALLPVTALLVKKSSYRIIILASGLIIGLWALLSIHWRLERLSRIADLLPGAHESLIFLKNIHIEMIPLAALVGVVLATLYFRLRKA